MINAAMQIAEECVSTASLYVQANVGIVCDCRSMEFYAFVGGMMVSIEN